jgi:hypothetical protein
VDDPSQSAPNWFEEESLTWSFVNQTGRYAAFAAFASRGSGVQVPLAPLSEFPL